MVTLHGRRFGRPVSLRWLGSAVRRAAVTCGTLGALQGCNGKSHIPEELPPQAASEPSPTATSAKAPAVVPGVPPLLAGESPPSEEPNYFELGEAESGALVVKRSSGTARASSPKKAHRT